MTAMTFLFRTATSSARVASPQRLRSLCWLTVLLTFMVDKTEDLLPTIQLKNKACCGRLLSRYENAQHGEQGAKDSPRKVRSGNKRTAHQVLAIHWPFVIMQRRPGTSAASSASSASSAPNGAHNGTQRPSLERTSSKTVRPQNKMVVFMTIVLPLLFVSLVLYLTGILSSEQHQHQQRHDEDADAVGRAPRKADNTRLKKGRSTTSKTKEDAASALDTVSTTSGGVEYHIVFSTGCSLYQDWQSYVFFFQAAAAQQPGTVTRIVSGCDAEEEQKMTDLFQDQIHPMAPGRFKIHFTPDFSKLPNGKSFVYWSKSLTTRDQQQCQSVSPGRSFTGLFRHCLILSHLFSSHSFLCLACYS